MKVLIDERGRKYLVEGRELHTKQGIVRIEDDAHRASSHLGHSFVVLDPDIVDIYEKMPRAGSFMLKKDIALILACLGVGSGMTVVDAGAGSGALAIFLGNVVGPGGRVVTYERNRDFAERAERNLGLAGLQGVVEVRVRDVLDDGFDEPDSSADAVTLDMKESWKMISEAKRVLRRGGRTAIYTVYVEHARAAHEALLKEGFAEVRTIETATREMEFRRQGSRPKTGRVGHSGYLTFGRKV